MVRGYRSISFETATLLARIPPLFLQATRQQRIYEKIRDLKEREELTTEKKKEMRQAEDLAMTARWANYLDDPALPEARVRNAILPIFNEWLTRQYGQLTFHLTQILTGHGSFGSFLQKIEKADTALCPYCGENDTDTPDHTFKECPHWEDSKTELKKKVGDTLEIELLVREITRDAAKWRATADFAYNVMTIKEKKEWERQQAARQRGRPGRQRRRGLP